jgi:hypothetical protein
MKHAVYTHLTEDDMDSIDVHDLPEDQAQLLAAFVEFLRQQKQAAGAAPEARTPMPQPFATWHLGVKGRLTREEIYEHR